MLSGLYKEAEREKHNKRIRNWQSSKGFEPPEVHLWRHVVCICIWTLPVKYAYRCNSKHSNFLTDVHVCAFCLTSALCSYLIPFFSPKLFPFFPSFPSENATVIDPNSPVNPSFFSHSTPIYFVLRLGSQQNTAQDFSKWKQDMEHFKRGAQLSKMSFE